MSYHDRFTDNYREHERELRRDAPRPGDKDFPARFDKPLTTAMDIVVLVKRLPNYSECEQLIEQYAGMVASIARADDAAERYNAVAGKGGANAPA